MTRSATWLKSLAVVLALFAAGHTLGTAGHGITRDPREAALFDAMRSFRFPAMGFERSYWDFYRGFAFIVSVLLVVLAAMAWQLAAVSRTDARRALPMAVTLMLGSLGLLVLGIRFFFAVPIVLSGIAAACSAGAVLALVRDARNQAEAPLHRSGLKAHH